jgi:hypothetical protein
MARSLMHVHLIRPLLDEDQCHAKLVTDVGNLYLPNMENLRITCRSELIDPTHAVPTSSDVAAGVIYGSRQVRVPQPVAVTKLKSTCCGWRCVYRVVRL